MGAVTSRITTRRVAEMSAALVRFWSSTGGGNEEPISRRLRLLLLTSNQIGRRRRKAIRTVASYLKPTNVPIPFGVK
jgi:hypothetical protein